MLQVVGVQVTVTAAGTNVKWRQTRLSLTEKREQVWPIPCKADETNTLITATLPTPTNDVPAAAAFLLAHPRFQDATVQTFLKTLIPASKPAEKPADVSANVSAEKPVDELVSGDKAKAVADKIAKKHNEQHVGA